MLIKTNGVSTKFTLKIKMNRTQNMPPEYTVVALCFSATVQESECSTALGKPEPQRTKEFQH